MAPYSSMAPGRNGTKKGSSEGVDTGTHHGKGTYKRQK